MSVTVLCVCKCHMSFCHFRCDFDDTAQYRVSAMNSKGELSAFASVVVKSMSKNDTFSTFINDYCKCSFIKHYKVLR